MTLRELLKAAQEYPRLMDGEIYVAIKSELEQGEKSDALWIHFKPVQSAMFGGGGLVLWGNSADEKKQLYLKSVTPFPQIMAVGPVPDCLK